MPNPVFDSKYTKTIESVTPTGSLYYTIYYDFSAQEGRAFVNLIELTLPDGSVIPLGSKKYADLYENEEDNLSVFLRSNP